MLQPISKTWDEYMAKRQRLLDEMREWVEANPAIAVAWDEAREENAQRLEARHDFITRNSALLAADVPDRIRDAIHSGLNESVAVKAVRTFIGSSKTFLLLTGSPGCGKSVAAAEGIWARRAGVFFRAVSAAKLSAFDTADRQAFDKLCRTPLLVLDDLGAETLHDGWRPALDELIDERYGARRRTILTSNLDPQGFKARYGDRIADRIRGDGYVQQCGDKSLRRSP